jgi:hypothetical protein
MNSEDFALFRQVTHDARFPITHRRYTYVNLR